MPTFCRHGRFLERCPICSKTLPGNAPARRPAGGSASRRTAGSGARSGAAGRRRGGGGGAGLRVSRQQRAADDGYESPLLPGVHASADAERLAAELAFANGRLLALEARGADARAPDFYADVRALGAVDLERATWACFLTAYLCPLESDDPFAGIRVALAVERDELHELSGIALGPRSSHDPARGEETLRAYRSWYAQVGSQASAFAGDASWTAERRFERLFERLALPGMARVARYELLVLLGALAPYELRPDSLQLAGARSGSSEDATTLAAKRLFAIGDPLLLERRAAALADAIPVPLAALELALWNWAAEERATLGFPPDVADGDTLQLARAALAL
ncbi:MAG TPA: hypothetical protein VK707_07960 [Solirubrobacteraceae bacterium]|nr:hypothetical protein [Solirubrobacteraceae bacterium]